MVFEEIVARIAVIFGDTREKIREGGWLALGLVGMFFGAAMMSCMALIFMANQNLVRTQKMGRNAGLATAAQKTLEEWKKGVEGRVGVAIYDWEAEEMLAEIDMEEKFGIGSLIDLPLAYEGYMKLSSNFYQPDSKIKNGQTRIECLRRLMVEADAECREAFIAELGEAILATTLKNRFNLVNTSRGQTTPRDITKMLGMYLKGVGLAEEYRKSVMAELERTRPDGSGFLQMSGAGEVYGRSSGGDGGWREAVVVTGADGKSRYLVGMVMERKDEKKVIEFGRKIGRLLGERR